MIEFIDTHQHLIYRETLGYGWTASIPALASGDFSLSDYVALTHSAGIAGTIFMETGVDDADYKSEARLVATLIGQNNLLGQIASCRPENTRGFGAWLEEGAGLNVRGYRRILHVVSDEISQTTQFRRNLKLIGSKGLPFDMCFLARQLPLALELAKHCPDQTLILDHCGVPDVSNDGFVQWAADITALAALPHVHCKLSGISAYFAFGMATLETLTPWVDHIINAFGPSRIVWGGDWPVVNLGVGLPRWIALSRILIAGLTASEQRAIAADNARRLYRL